jgi:hypothetical protein
MVEQLQLLLIMEASGIAEVTLQPYMDLPQL